jgi:hypothetical protein
VTFPKSRVDSPALTFHHRPHRNLTMLHRTPLFIVAVLALALGLAIAEPAFAGRGAGTITARAQVISDRPSRDAQEAGEALLRAMGGSGGSSDAVSWGSLLAADGLSQLSIVTTAGTPTAQLLVIEFVAN